MRNMVSHQSYEYIRLLRLPESMSERKLLLVCLMKYLPNNSGYRISIHSVFTSACSLCFG